MNGKSLNIKEEKLNKLKDIIPEAFTENKVDWEKLKASLGDNIEFKNERYVLNWAGKSDSFRILQSPTTATLVPDRNESVDFDSTENIFIEGENLEVLKVLQKSYFGKIKMIYIDPPYNTGNDNFIYPDKFSETREEYLSRIGDKDESGYMTREGLFRKNSKDSGHYHSNWLSMMYPRLFLARNLLKDDGVIFVSIDDNEVHNLRMIMNEVFGEENFIANIVWKHTQQSKNDERHFSRHYNSIVVYSKFIDQVDNFYFRRSETDNINYSNPDNDPKGKWRSGDVRSPNFRKTLCYDIQTPKGNIIKAPQNGWRWSEYVLKQKISSSEIIFNETQTKIIRKIYLSNQIGRTPENIWDGEIFGTTRNANSELKELFEGEVYFDTPKPVQLIKKIMELNNNDSDYYVLDFFAGSATTAHAVMDLNKEDGGKRKFICVQLPEKTDEKSEAYKAGYKTIADIGKERIRRVIKKIKEEQTDKLDLEGKENQDLGFKVFKLQDSNFKIWRNKITSEEQLLEQLQDHLEPLDENAKTEDVLYELLLKSGIPLTAKITKNNGIFVINDNEIALLLEKMNEKLIKEVIEINPRKVITLDRLFNNNDQLKTNTALQMKDAEIEFKVV
ncbi:MAG TPA: site-specific DNA-methyltransferase [Bacteroidetes bacterium]|nr:site-specific DNA-methyltransferase [Bacteroidota bacterium]